MTATKSDGTDARSRDPRKRIEDAETAEATAETAQLEVSMMAAAIDRPAGRSSLRAELFSEAKVHWDAQHDRQIFCQVRLSTRHAENQIERQATGDSLGCGAI